MKSVIQIVFTVKEIEDIIREKFNGMIPKDSKISLKADDKWVEPSTYNRDSKECIRFEFEHKQKEDIIVKTEVKKEYEWNDKIDEDESFLL